MSLQRLKELSSVEITESFKKGLSGNDACIVVGNSFCTTEGFSDDTLDLIAQTLTYDNQEVIFQIQQMKIQLGMAYRYRNIKRVQWYKARIAELESDTKICWFKRNKFPTGHLHLVRDALNKNGIGFEIRDERKNNAPSVELNWHFPPPEPRYFQLEMAALGLTHHRGVFEAAVGSGKTFVCQMLVHELKVPALIILPSKDLSIQTYDSFIQAFGKKSVELVTNATKAKTSKPVRICTIHTLVALAKKNVLGVLLQGLGMVCIDEVHHAGARSYTDLLPFFEHIYFRFGFSGTFMRNDSRTLDMWGFLSTVLYRYSASQATKDGFLTPLQVKIHEIEGIRAGSYHQEYSRNYCENENLLEKIKSIVLHQIHPSDQVLILVGRKEKSGLLIHEYLKALGISCDYVSGDSKRDYVRKALQDFNDKKIKVLVGSTIIGEGIDVRSTDHLIMAQGGKSEIAVTQAVGRAVRLYPGKNVASIHDFKFQYTKYLEAHLHKRLAIYEKNFEGRVAC